MYEHRSKPLLPRRQFFSRLFRSFRLGTAVIAVSLGVGMAGYHIFESLPWIDAFANAAMILSGMGPLAPMQTSAGKIFAGCYALYSGLALVTATGIVFAPVFHRFLHKFHLEVGAESKRQQDG
jgi:hypothetical protein